MTSPASHSNDMRLRSAKLTDFDAVLELRNSLDTPTLSAEALRAAWQSLDLDQQTLVALNAQEEIIGYAELQQRQPDWFAPRVWIRVEQQRHGIGTALLHRLEMQAPRLANSADYHLVAQLWRHEVAAQRLAKKAGYNLSSTFQVMEIQLTEPVAQPDTPGNIIIRPFRPGRDELAIYEADEEAFIDERGKLPRTFEQWSNRLNMHTDHFDPTLWLIAWDQEVIAGASICEASSDRGEIMHLGVRRPWRHQGLGMLLLRSSLSKFYQRGIYTVKLNVDAHSLTNAQQLYERAGFQTINAYHNYIRDCRV